MIENHGVISSSLILNTMPKSWKEEDLIFACKTYYTKADVLRHLNLSLRPNNYRHINKYIKNLNIDISHFRQPGRKKLNLSDKRSLKRRLINLVKYECQICLIKDWNNKKIILQMDHINGDCFDNRLENVRLLCPNCHSQTETFCRGLRKNEVKTNNCIDCNKIIRLQSKRCLSCHTKSRLNVNKLNLATK